MRGPMVHAIEWRASRRLGARTRKPSPGATFGGHETSSVRNSYRSAKACTCPRVDKDCHSSRATPSRQIFKALRCRQPLPHRVPLSHNMGNPLALFQSEESTGMISKATKALMLIATITLMTSAFVPLDHPNPPRSLMLLGAGLVSLAGLTRRHYADE